MKDEYGKDFSKEVSINKFKLEDECERHPELFRFYSDLLAETKSEKDVCFNKLEFMKAEIELTIRKGNYKNAPDKITDSTVKALLLNDTRVHDQMNRLDSIKKELYHLESAMGAIEHRRSKINNLVQLYQSGYFSKPSGYKKENNVDAAQKKQRQNIKRGNKDE